ncbi:recombinase [Spirochaetia bacterium]|nr:recombinase [Spirochaetia bacterium]
MPKTERQKIIAKLDKLCREILLLRDDIGGGMYRCISCGKIEPLERSNVSHYCGRAYLITRWNLNNIWLSCVSCNKWKSGNLIEYRKALIEKIGLTEVEHLEAIYKQPAGYTLFDLTLIYQQLRITYEQMKRGNVKNE